MRQAARLTITGVVQGVGFRPYVHRLANEYNVAGWVRNRANQVEIHAEGDTAALAAFSAAIPAMLPPLAHIESMASALDQPDGVNGFRILSSRESTSGGLPVPPDVVTCDACALEIFDPVSRRHRYAFTTCTDCGPRYSVIEALPYDRERTSLSAFPLCEQCRREYVSPDDRRYHAESLACPDCGPHLQLEPAGTATPSGVLRDEEVVRATADAILDGGIAALRGLGGFHLAVDATNEQAVLRLRARKHRSAKPLACMVRTIDDAMRWTLPTSAELAWLGSRERPVVLISRRPDAMPALAESIAPGLDRIGIMLPSTPLHYLLLEAVGRPLVMTSGNLSEEPLAAGNDEARARLANIADVLLVHDRDIVARIDDSVVRLVNDVPVMLRRARGYAPLPLPLPRSSPVALLAVGGHLKNTFTLVDGGRAFVSPHIGHLESLESMAHWRAVADRYTKLFHVRPQAFVADEHDGYLSTRIAEDAAAANGMPLMRVQHHHAHVAAVAAEHGVTDRVLGLAFDGTGAGTDGTIWGMEFLIADLRQYERVAHLLPAPLPGGDVAISTPWRTLAGILSLDRDAFAPFQDGLTVGSEVERRVVSEQIARSINAPLASSAGRLFDAAASLLGVCQVNSYEGEAAMRLEAVAGTVRGILLPFPTRVRANTMPVLDPVPLFAALFERKARGVSVEQLAADFHDSVANGALALTRRLSDLSGIRTIVLSGGCFQNARLLERMRTHCLRSGFKVLVAQSLPPNDGGLSYGQAAVAAARLAFSAEQGNR